MKDLKKYSGNAGKNIIYSDTGCKVILIISLLLKLCYAFLVRYDISPHDLGNLDRTSALGYGHLSYITYLAENHHLPDFSPINADQFYHPPLFHIVGAIFYNIFRHFFDTDFTFELLQAINMLFAWGTSVVVYKISKLLASKSNILLVSLISFHPFLFHIGAALNNDCFVIFFMTLTVYCTVRWIQTKKISDIIKMALFLALGMLSKTSGVLLAPALALLFLYCLWKTDNKKELIKQYIVFGFTSIPIGMAWLMRQKLLFGVGFGYVPVPSEWLSFSDDSTILKILKTVISVWVTSVYDENWTLLTTVCGLIVGILSAVIAIWLLINWIKSVKSESGSEFMTKYKIFSTTAFITFIVGFIGFIFKYPYLCSLNFRYIFPVLLFPLLSVGNLESYSKIMKGIIFTFCIASVVMLLCYDINQ